MYICKEFGKGSKTSTFLRREGDILHDSIFPFLFLKSHVDVYIYIIMWKEITPVIEVEVGGKGMIKKMSHANSDNQLPTECNNCTSI